MLMFKHRLLIFMIILVDSYRPHQLLGSFEPQSVYQNVPNIWCTTFQDSSVIETEKKLLPWFTVESYIWFIISNLGWFIVHNVLLDFSLTVKAATLIFISGCGLAISSV